MQYELIRAVCAVREPGSSGEDHLVGVCAELFSKGACRPAVLFLMKAAKDAVESGVAVPALADVDAALAWMASEDVAEFVRLLVPSVRQVTVSTGSDGSFVFERMVKEAWGARTPFRQVMGGQAADGSPLVSCSMSKGSGAEMLLATVSALSPVVTHVSEGLARRYAEDVARVLRAKAKKEDSHGPDQEDNDEDSGDAHTSFD